MIHIDSTLFLLGFVEWIYVTIELACLSTIVWDFRRDFLGGRIQR